MKNMGLLWMACFCCLALHARQGTPLNGLVTDADGKALSKVKISLTGDTDRKTRTDRKGRFGLADVMPTDTLRLDYKGEAYAIPVEGRKHLRIVWYLERHTADAREDTTLVDIGYGLEKRKRYAGYSNGISGEELRKSGASTLLEALQGRIAGLRISTPNRPGDQGDVLIQGTKSILASSTPLFVVDGMIVEDISSVSLYEVEHVEVMKDASIYGSRGANGAILIRTRRGTK